MSVYTQEVLGLLKRNKKKTKLDKIRDHFEFGKLYRNSTINTGAAYNPTMEPFVIKWGDFKCATEEGMVRQDPTGAVERYITMWTDPVFQGECNTATITKTIISQNAAANEINIAGDLDVDNNLNVDGNGVIDLQLTAGSANILDLTDNRIVIVGPNGELEDDANFTMDGTTFTANVDVVHGTDVPAGQPATTTRINSILKLEGPVHDSLGNPGALNKVLVGLADGRVKWQDDDVVEALTYGSIWRGDSTNYKEELAIGTAGQILMSDGTTLNWVDDPYVDGSGTLYRLPLWTPDGDSLGDSILIQDGDVSTPATQVTVEGKAIVEGDLTAEANTFLQGNVEVNGTTKLDTLAQDDALVQVVVRDPANDNILKFRDAASIKPQVGFDTLNMTPDGWASTDGNFNAYVKLDDTGGVVKNIKDMTWLVDGDRVVVIAENTKQGSLLADNAIRFPTWGSGSQVFNHTTWNQASIGGSWSGAIDNGYQTSTLLYGEKIKFKGEMYDTAGVSDRQINWDACCKIYSNNLCPVANNLSFTINEDEGLANNVNVVDNGYGGYGLTYSVVQAPSNTQAFNLNTSTGAFTLTPDANFFGTITFTYKATDGYCESNVATVTVTVNAVDDAPEWTSTDPVTANTYPNLTGGDTWTYNWTVADVDTPCGNLTFPSQTIPSWLTFTNNGNCTGTLTGTFPNTGGTFPVQLNVSDGTSTASQSFTIGGLAVTQNTYFVFWSDTSGSMNSTISVMSRMVSAAEVKSSITTSVTGSPNITLTNGTNTRKINTSQGDASKAYLAIHDGMEVTGSGVPSGTTVSSGGGTTSLVLSQNVTITGGTVLTFTPTQAMKDADYTNTSNLRNLLQDFYATGGTKASGNNNPATNGQDMYDSHIYWGHDPAERQIDHLGNRNQGATIGASGYFPNADQIVVMGFADESSDYQLGGTSAGTWGDRDQTTVPTITTDVSSVKNFISTLETAAGNNSIYRGIFFNVIGNYNTSSTFNLEPLLGTTGLNATGGRTANGFTYTPPEALAYNINTQTLYPESSGSPTRIKYRNDMTDGASESYYYNEVRAGLNSVGFSL